jgi:predicted amidophosphoribosyltransferase
MVWTLLGCALVLAMLLKYLKPFGERCPQCQARRPDRGHPLCPECGWIYEVPGEEDQDYGSKEEEDLKY